jgi:thiol:disulfide interchange protein
LLTLKRKPKIKIMKHLFFCTLFTITLASFTKSEPTTTELLQVIAVNFETNLEAAKSKAKAANKNIFLYAYAAWSGPCKRMMSTTFTSEKVATYLNQNFINLSLECENQDGDVSPEGKTVLEAYNIKSYPVVIVIDATGKMLKSSLSVKDEAQLLEFLK